VRQEVIALPANRPLSTISFVAAADEAVALLVLAAAD